MHRVFVDGGWDRRPGEVVVGGEEGAHAVQVKRLRAGEVVEVLDGCGCVGHGEVLEVSRGGRDLRVRVRVGRVEVVERVGPVVHVCSAVPKGDRAGQLIDQLSQVGAATWSALTTDHGIAEGGGHKLERLARIAREGSKQCGRAWALTIGGAMTVAEALVAPAGVRVLVGEAGGGPAGGVVLGSGDEVRILIGPEGGWSARERALMGGVEMVRAGPHVMRIETAAVACVVALLNAGRV